MTGTRFAIGLFAGALAGAVAGLLVAPNTGKESRQIVGSRAGMVRSQAGGWVTTIRQRVTRATPEAVEQESNGHVSTIS